MLSAAFSAKIAYGFVFASGVFVVVGVVVIVGREHSEEIGVALGGAEASVAGAGDDGWWGGRSGLGSTGGWYSVERRDLGGCCETVGSAVCEEGVDACGIEGVSALVSRGEVLKSGVCWRGVQEGGG